MTGFYHKVDRSLSTVWQSQKIKSCLEQKKWKRIYAWLFTSSPFASNFKIFNLLRGWRVYLTLHLLFTGEEWWRAVNTLHLCKLLIDRQLMQKGEGWRVTDKVVKFFSKQTKVGEWAKEIGNGNVLRRCKPQTLPRRIHDGLDENSALETNYLL